MFEVLTKKYKEIQLLGEGTYGQVYSVISKKTGVEYAAKIVPLLTDEQKLRFQKEVKVLKQLKASINSGVENSQLNICLMKKRFTAKLWNGDNGCRKFGVLVMEKMDMDLVNFLTNVNTRNDLLSDQKVKEIFRSICEAVNHCHQRGIAHMDIKPDNILLKLNPENEIESVKLCDFGHSRSWKQQRGSFSDIKVLVTPQDSLGTKDYLPPELRNLVSPSLFLLTAADVYCLGLVLYALLTGSLPMLRKNGSPRVRSLRSIVQLSREVKACDIVSSMMHPDPLSRPSVSEILEHPWLCS